MKRGPHVHAVVSLFFVSALGAQGGGRFQSDESSPPPNAPRQASSVQRVLDRAREAVAQYLVDTALLVGEEQCEQRSFEARRDNSGIGGVIRQPRGERRWQAELALVPTPGLAAAGYPWTEFRDVLIVDGEPVRDHDTRLSTLLQQRPTLPIAQARAITRYSASFNLGRERTTNTPSVPLLVLATANAKRFEFGRAGEERVNGVATLKVKFRELSAPTLIRAAGSDCPASGTVWVEPNSGRVVQAELRCGDAQRAVPAMTVRYDIDRRLQLWVPVEMREQPFDGLMRVGIEWVEGRCEYRNYRRYETGARLILK